MPSTVVEAFFVISLFVPVIAVIAGVAAIAWPARRAARTLGTKTEIPAHP